MFMDRLRGLVFGGWDLGLGVWGHGSVQGWNFQFSGDF